MDSNDLVNGVPYSWLPAYGEAVETNQTNRNILETILEETSDDDEDSGRWNNISNSWTNSDSSENQSVIEVDLSQDAETLSERDFICPAKRRRQDHETAVENFAFKRPFSDGDRYKIEPNLYLDTTDYFKRPEARFRFDEMCPELYSDSDSMSYNSLSRSSSLIQFESLERQIDTPLSGSTPSLTDTALDTKLKDFLFNKKNTNISNNMIINAPLSKTSQLSPVHHNEQNGNGGSSSDSDTYSSVGSTSSSYSSEESYYLNQSDKTVSLEEVTKSVSPVNNKNKARTKNSIESLSEDSGYCDQSSYVLRVKSKSNPNILAAHCEGDDELFYKSMDDLSAASLTTKQQRLIQNQKLGATKIAATPVQERMTKNNQHATDDGNSCESIMKSDERRQSLTTSENAIVSSVKQRVISTSSPDLLIEHFYQSNQLAGKLTRKTIYQLFSKYLYNQPHRSGETDTDFCVVSSVPDDLNLCCDPERRPRSPATHHYSWTTDTESYASKNVNLFTLKTESNQPHPPLPPPPQVHTHLTASYANLTLLNYSDDNLYDMNFDKQQQQANNRKYASDAAAINGEASNTFKSEFSSLLDEITAHFDRNLSILNDQDEDYDPFLSAAFEEKPLRPPPRRSPRVSPVPASEPYATFNDFPRVPPQPPPRKSSKNRLMQSPLAAPLLSLPEYQSTVNQSTLVPILESSIECDRYDGPPPLSAPPPLPPSLPPRNHIASPQPILVAPTFDQDPTNLVTCYTASLEQCNFDPTPVSIVIPVLAAATAVPSRKQELTGKRGEVVCNSTPNLCGNWGVYEPKDKVDDFDHHKSLKDVTTCSAEKGILSSGARSKDGLIKGVSFCPIVSEISWKDTNAMAEDEDDDDDDDEDSSDVESDEFEPVQVSAKDEFDESDNDYNDDDGEFGEYLLPAPTHTFTTSMTIMDRLGDHQHIEDNERNENYSHYITSTYINNVQIPIVADIHTSSGSGSSSSTSDEYVVNCDGDDEVEEVVNENYSTVVNSCKTYVDQSSECGIDSKIIKKIHKQEEEEQINMNVQQQQQQQQQPKNGVGQNKIQNNNLVKQFEVKKNLINNNNQASGNSIEYVKSDTISKVNLADTHNSEKNVTKDAPKIKKKDGILSRLGLRFSFRGKKTNAKKPEAINNYNQLDEQRVDSKKVPNNKPRHQDIIFIPLKDPSRANVESFIKHEIEAAAPSGAAGEKEQSPASSSGSGSGSNGNGTNNHVLISKPPLPKHAPRSSGVGGGGARRTPKPHAQRAISPTTDDDGDDTVTTGRHYHEIVPANQLRSTHRASGTAVMGSEQKIGLIETNLDTHETIITGKTRSLMELGGPPNTFSVRPSQREYVRANGCADSVENVDQPPRRPHKSMEFLLDKENHRTILPPENELQKSHDNSTLSEHQLRVQASLQRLNVPDWYKNYGNTPTNTSVHDSSGILRKRNSDVGRTGWTGLSSKTTSLSSLGSQRCDRSPVMLSPSAHSHHGGQTGFTRWSTSHLNSNQTSPSVSTRGSFSRGNISGGYQSAGNTLRNSIRQPYLGWRSQEKLSQPRTPAERLASSLLQQKQQQQQQQQQQQSGADKPPKVPRPDHLSSGHSPLQQHPPVTPEIQHSIKEVTSAIVHYVNDQTSRNSRSRSTSPSQRCWLESSFVGTKPLESPQTPIIDNTSFASATASARHQNHHSLLSSSSATAFMMSTGGSGGGTNLMQYRNSRQNGSVPTFSLPPERPTPATLLDDIDVEDVLVNLLGLPANSRPDDITNQMTETKHQLHVEIPIEQRRRSEGDTHQRKQKPTSSSSTTTTNTTSNVLGHMRKLSLDSVETKNVEVVRCRYPKCDAVTTPAEAKKTYKSCHNCSHMYCSRECRRQHWDKHRKACLHSRVSALCRQVLSACKDDPDTLRHLSVLARKGFLSQGRGVIRILYRSPESAEQFVKQGFQSLGEVMYVRWPDLMPAEMGPELYSELLRLSTEYKPESKMLLYVAICVVSEAPSSASAPVKWERQLVSRCAKLKLCKTIVNDMAHHQPPLIPATADSNNDVLVLTFNLTRRNTQKIRDLVFIHIQSILRQRGINLRKHFPDIFQRLSTYVEGASDRFVPVTIHPRDSGTGRGFVCIIMPITQENEIKIPSNENGAKVQVIDVTQLLTEFKD